MRTKYPIILTLLIFTACAPIMHNEVEPTPHAPTQEQPTQTFTAHPTNTSIPPTQTPDLIDQVCSPLENETLDEIFEIITQPFKMPRRGNDDGHQGVDFAYYRRNDRVGIEGLKVFASLPGEVITVLNNRWPYGHGLIIETPIDQISPSIMGKIAKIEILPTVAPDPRVNCPPGELSFTLDETRQSLYILYGHLQNPVKIPVGEEVACGQHIGEVGNSGYSSNPHLHFETRIGPSGARFDSMAYYIVESTQSERYNYCVWRVSNRFQLFDPMLLLSPIEE